MGKNNTGTFMQFAVLAMVLTAALMVEEAKSFPICNVDTNDLEKCRPAVTGDNPPAPSLDCCAVVKAADLECLCQYISYSGIDTSKIKAVLTSCNANYPSCISA